MTPDDLAYDLERRDIHPYDPNAFTASLYWQCLPKKDVKFTYETWRGTDGMGAWDEIVTMCAFEIAVKQGNERQGYIGRRGLPVEHCQDLQDEWEKLTKGEDIVCLNGEGGAYHTKKDTTKKYKLWTWEKTKTSKGCGSFFYGICNTAGCAKGTCPL